MAFNRSWPGIVRIDRRSFLTGMGAAAGVAIASPALIGRAAGEARRWEQDPFSLGVAAGSIEPDGFTLWTRLAPDPLSPDASACPAACRPSPSRSAMRSRRMQACASSYGAAPRRRSGLRPFGASRCGRTGTRPALLVPVHERRRGQPDGPGPDEPRRPGSAPDRLRFAVASCSNYEHGYFAAYRHLADEQPDFVLFLGDYIYEYVSKRPRVAPSTATASRPTTLSGYRNRYAQYRLDPDLQRLHAEAPALVTWDDHEVQNDYADQWSQDLADPQTFLKRRAAAYQAFYEHMPVRAEPVAAGRAGHADLRPLRVRRSGRDFDAGRAAISLARSLLRTAAPPWRRPSWSAMPPAPSGWRRSAPCWAREQEAWLLRRAGAVEGALEHPRPGRDDGAASPDGR